MPRQEAKSSTCPPMTGAMIGARPLTIMRIAKKRVSSGPSQTSRAIAREMTMPLAPAKPMRKRNVRKIGTFSAKVQPTAAMVNPTMPRSSGRRLP